MVSKNKTPKGSLSELVKALTRGDAFWLDVPSFAKMPNEELAKYMSCGYKVYYLNDLNHNWDGVYLLRVKKPKEGDYE